ncbi:transposase, partial [Streptomyces phaeochromogenes]|uniref:transposase n=1 Tax=Streptomyces phaeochromogenes TaxID=1923 RepID=UPI0033E5CAB2
RGPRNLPADPTNYRLHRRNCCHLTQHRGILNTHVSRAMQELIAARLWLTVYQLPPYAPELNPVEGVWSHLKRSLANLTKHNLDQLTALVKTRLKRMQYQPGLIEGFMAKTGLDLQPP